MTWQRDVYKYIVYKYIVYKLNRTGPRTIVHNNGVNSKKKKLRRPDRGVLDEPLKVWGPKRKASSRRSSITFIHIHTHGGLL